MVACAATPVAPPTGSDAERRSEPVGSRLAARSSFSPDNESPRTDDARSKDADEQRLNQACGESDSALLMVAAHLAAEQTDTTAALDVETLSYALRAAGSPYVWPRAWLFTGAASEVGLAQQRMLRWLATFSDGGVRRCGVALVRRAGERISVAAVAVDALADLRALPTRVRVGQWLEVRASLRVPASEAKLLVLGPRGAPHSVPTSLEHGEVRARFNVDQPGTWLVQLLGAVDGGPRPLLEALLFAGTEPPSTLTVQRAPGEAAAKSAPSAQAALYAMVDAARDGEQVPRAVRDLRLESVAQAHAEAMRRARKTAHDAGDGDLNQRLEQLGLELLAGENVAHAASATLAQRALWASPSHRENLLFAGFDRVGIGVSPDPDGTLWVCQVFASSR